VAQVNLDRVEPGLHREPRRCCVIRDHSVDVITSGLSGKFEASGVELPRGRQRPAAIGAGIREGSGVSDLSADRSTFGVNGVGQFT
jgi:hypothetical protein